MDIQDDIKDYGFKSRTTCLTEMADQAIHGHPVGSNYITKSNSKAFKDMSIEDSS